MKIQPVSADLLVKVALGVALIGAAVWAVRKIGGAAGEAAHKVYGAAVAAVDGVNPLNPDNYFASGANALATAVAGRPETTGGLLRTITSNDDERIRAMLEGRPIPRASNISSNTMAGGWDNPGAFFQ